MLRRLTSAFEGRSSLATSMTIAAVAIPVAYLSFRAWTRLQSLATDSAAATSTSSAATPALSLDERALAGLRDEVRRRYEDAVAAGAVDPLATETFVLTDHGLTFIVSTVRDAAAKAKPTAAPATAASGPPRDVFAEVDPRLLVSETALARFRVVLNKFPVTPEHVVLVTRDFEPQHSPLRSEDWAGFWPALLALDGFGFFNCGLESGASQPRRHVQIIPGDRLRSSLPTPSAAAAAVPDHALLPVESLIRAEQRRRQWATLPEQPFVLPEFAFPHAVASLPSRLQRTPAPDAAHELQSVYDALLLRAIDREEDLGYLRGEEMGGGGAERSTPARPHNLLVTPEWMMVVLRHEAEWGGFNVNSVGYAGLFLARKHQLEALERVGPMAILQRCALKKHKDV